MQRRIIVFSVKFDIYHLLNKTKENQTAIISQFVFLWRRFWKLLSVSSNLGYVYNRSAVCSRVERDAIDDWWVVLRVSRRLGTTSVVAARKLFSLNLSFYSHTVLVKPLFTIQTQIDFILFIYLFIFKIRFILISKSFFYDWWFRKDLL